MLFLSLFFCFEHAIVALLDEKWTTLNQNEPLAKARKR